jgi:hypothetical protein
VQGAGPDQKNLIKIMVMDGALPGVMVPGPENPVSPAAQLPAHAVVVGGSKHGHPPSGKFHKLLYYHMLAIHRFSYLFLSIQQESQCVKQFSQ